MEFLYVIAALTIFVCGYLLGWSSANNKWDKIFENNIQKPRD